MMSWVLGTIESDLDEVIPKAILYGGADLEVMAAAMRPFLDVSYAGAEHDEQTMQRLAMEAAVGFYTLGKVARLMGGYAAGQIPSDDTWGDLTIYSVMGRYIRHHGEWRVQIEDDDRGSDPTDKRDRLPDDHESVVDHVPWGSKGHNRGSE